VRGQLAEKAGKISFIAVREISLTRQLYWESNASDDEVAIFSSKTSFYINSYAQDVHALVFCARSVHRKYT